MQQEHSDDPRIHGPTLNEAHQYVAHNRWLASQIENNIS
jgi:hypothetical protein